MQLAYRLILCSFNQAILYFTYPWFSLQYMPEAYPGS